MSLFNHQQAIVLASDWIALRAIWPAQVATRDQASVLTFFELPSNTLLNSTFVQIVAAYEAL